MADCVICDRHEVRCECIAERRTALLAVLDAAEAVALLYANDGDCCRRLLRTMKVYHYRTEHDVDCAMTILALAVGEARRGMA